MFKAMPFLLLLFMGLLQFVASDEVDDDLGKRLRYFSDKMGFCLSYFQYLRTDDFIIGKLKLPNMKMGDNVTVTFYGAYPAEIGYTTRFRGSLFPDESSEEIVNKVQTGQPITYRIDFPIGPRVPELETIVINGEELCAAAFGDVGDKLVFQHTLEIVNGSIPVFRQNLNIPFFAKVSTCGLDDTGVAHAGITPYIYGGKSVRQGEYPWLTAIFTTHENNRSYICSGSLITSEIILSAAHCFQGLKPENVEVKLGCYNLTNEGEENVVLRKVSAIEIHPEYRSDRSFSDADLALITMQEPVSFTKFINPICLWSEATDDSLIVGHTGVVAGWGSDEAGNSVTAVPKKVKTNIVSENECLRSLPVYTVITSPRTLCAGLRDGTGPCEGDSGGGLMIYRNGIWMLRGVISAGITDEQRCNLQQYTVYCDVAKHKPWLDYHVEKQDHPLTGALDDICGRVDEQGSEQPWLAAVYRKSTNGVVFFCTGALISSRNVLLPADCLNKPQKEIIHADFVRVYLGRYDLNSPKESNVFARDILEVIRHPKYEDVGGLFYDNDVAVLQLKNPVSFTKYVRPICLWSDAADHSEIEGQAVTLSSWNRLGILDEIMTVPNSSETKVVPMENCQRMGFNVGTTSRFLCTPRFGNNVDGILAIKRNDQWLLRGMSAANNVFTKKYRAARYRLYSDIAKYYTWIKSNTFE